MDSEFMKFNLKIYRFDKYSKLFDFSFLIFIINIVFWGGEEIYFDKNQIFLGYNE